MFLYLRYFLYGELSRGFLIHFLNNLSRVFMDCNIPLVSQGCLMICFFLIVTVFSGALVFIISFYVHALLTADDERGILLCACSVNCRR